MGLVDQAYQFLMSQSTNTSRVTHSKPEKNRKPCLAAATPRSLFEGDTSAPLRCFTTRDRLDTARHCECLVPGAVPFRGKVPTFSPSDFSIAQKPWSENIRAGRPKSLSGEGKLMKPLSRAQRNRHKFRISCQDRGYFDVA